MNSYITCLAFYIFSFNVLLAQPEASSVKYLDAETFTVDNGLSQGLINSITQDHFGFMWFGTMDGLNRYDGYNVSIFRNNPDDSGSLAENFITCIFEDSKKRLWIGTGKEGLDLFDREKESFIHFRHSENQRNSLSDDRILSISEDAFGALWIGTKNGLNKMTIEPGKKTASDNHIDTVTSFHSLNRVTFSHIQFDNSGKELYCYKEADAFQNGFDPSFFIGGEGTIFVRTEKDIFSIHPSVKNAETPVKIDSLLIEPGQSQSLSDIIKITGLPCKKDLFLYFLAKESVAHINPATGLVSLAKVLTGNKTVGSEHRQVTEDNLWFTFGFQLYQYIRYSQKVIVIKSPDPKQQLFISHSTLIFKDRTGIIWTGSAGYGVLKFNTVNEKFHRVTSPSVHLFSATYDNDIILKAGDSLYLLQKNIEEPALGWQKSINFFKEIYTGLKGTFLSGVIKGINGTVWLESKGIHRYDIKEKKLGASLTTPISWPALHIDKQDKLWYADGAMLCNLSGMPLKENRYAIPQDKITASFHIETIFKDARSIIWVAANEGLFSFDESKAKWNRYTFRSNDSTSLSSNLVISICPATDNRYLWIGTNGGGFNHFNKETGKCNRYSIINGLPNNVVYGILTDSKNKLWMSTNKGLSNFDPVTKKFENYTVDDGLQGNEFNFHAYCKAQDGTLFFGGVNGYNYFNPLEINPNPPQQPLLITDIKSNGHAIDFHEAGSQLSLPVYLTKKVVFNFTHNTIEVDFSAMTFKASTRDRYRYMLEGVDKEWVSSTTNHSAVYANLQPGSYIFKVKTGNSKQQYASLSIVILPPWYQTWWFNSLVVIFVLALLYSFYRYNLNQQIKLFKDHQRIAGDLHDEIGSTLSSIHIYSEVALSKIDSKPRETESYLKQISNNVENTIGSLDDIVWMLKQKNDRFEDIGNRMRAAAVSICEAGGYTLHLKFAERMNELKFGKEARKNLYLIYKEAINNVMKYANGKNLFIDLSVIENEITLSVRDDGKGFDENVKNSRNGLENMRKRARDLKGKLEIISAKGMGTTITLKFDCMDSRLVK